MKQWDAQKLRLSFLFISAAADAVFVWVCAKADLDKIVSDCERVVVDRRGDPPAITERMEDAARAAVLYRIPAKVLAGIPGRIARAGAEEVPEGNATEGNAFGLIASMFALLLRMIVRSGVPFLRKNRNDFIQTVWPDFQARNGFVGRPTHALDRKYSIDRIRQLQLDVQLVFVSRMPRLSFYRSEQCRFSAAFASEAAPGGVALVRVSMDNHRALAAGRQRALDCESMERSRA